MTTTSSGAPSNARPETRSKELFARAQKLIPGGVSSPVRAFRHVGGDPVFIKSGKGSVIEDEDGNSYVDFCLAWGPLILGHAHPAVVEATGKALKDGFMFGACHRFEAQLAERVLEAFPYADRARFVVSGTEAVLTAVRLARAHTNRRLLVKFSGCYHGHVDALLVKAGSGVATLGLAESAGVTEGTAHDTVVLPLGDEEALRQCFQKYGSEVAACILEPLPANNGLLPQPGSWLKLIRDLTSEHGALLIFDEVITGFRFGYHGVAKVSGVDVEPDLTTLGKIIGGGMPVGGVVGRRAILERLAPLGRVYQAGTMAGNPVALAAGIATLDELKKGDAHKLIAGLGARLEEGLKHKKIPVQRMGGVFWIYLDDTAPIPHAAEAITDKAVEAYRARYRGWLDKGVYLPPSAYEVGFLSSAHDNEDVDKLVAAVAGG